MLNILVVEGPTDGCDSELGVVSVPEGFDPEVLLLISGFMNAVDSGEMDVEELENLNLVLVVMNVSADDDSEVAPLADTVEALSDGGGASEEATEFSDDTTKDPEAEIEEPRDGDFTSSVDVRGSSEVI